MENKFITDYPLSQGEIQDIIYGCDLEIMTPEAYKILSNKLHMNNCIDHLNKCANIEHMWRDET